MSDPPIEILLCSRGRGPADAWERSFRRVRGVRVLRDDALDRTDAALLCPGDSFGLLELGVERQVAERWGEPLRRSLREALLAGFRGEIPVGAAVTVEPGAQGVPRLVYAPLHRAGEEIARSLNPYLAFRAALLEALRQGIPTLAVPPLLGPGGRMPPVRVARQMRAALDATLGKPPRYPGIFAARKAQQGLLE